MWRSGPAEVSNFCRVRTADERRTEGNPGKKGRRDASSVNTFAILHASAESAPSIFEYPSVPGIKYNRGKSFLCRTMEQSCATGACGWLAASFLPDHSEDFIIAEAKFFRARGIRRYSCVAVLSFRCRE